MDEHDQTGRTAGEPAGDGRVTQQALIAVTCAVMVVGIGIGLVIGATAFDSDTEGDLAVAESADDTAAESSRFEAAKDACAAESSYITVLDDGSALEVLGAGEERPGATLDEVFCVLDELAVPESTVSRMTSTRALDGTLDASWDDVAASWSYHPDNGLTIILEGRS
ncbi:hypothetical protein EF847_22000 [Actinobacteria bacterium YIM 96077]|uniref:Uncharacterized protein n=1 Tax=Phytoactinopolyspora halophila TaxID=1981511 RepID=A0A329QVT8_9ACTN|nr:hypothetical protein [Phytoactinopolyspora halophila]AYY14965.1 hypothetical protein EF847_22000 [Actinobacteria bacterium YIM 96077]RAW15422.1 hypothetical protein DPM12_09230 [Phytoactinopolyspora halophila]